MKKIISLIIVCTIIISGMFIYGKSDKKDLLEDNNGPIIAAVIDGKASTTFPTTNKYTATVECTRNGIKQDVGAKATWNGTKWVVSFNDISAGNVRCNAIFEKTKAPTGWYEAKNGTLLASLRDSNELETPLTIPGEDISSEKESLLASAMDDYGTSYYFRGAVKNNYVQFANKCWRIVRITGNGSIKLILYNNNSSSVSNPCASANNSVNSAFGRDSKFGSLHIDNAYVGFMYGTEGATDYASTHANTNKSTILENLETWYTNNLASYENKLADTIWCNDKSTVSGGFGYGTADTIYSSDERISSTKQPTFICPNDNNGGKLSKFTVSDTIFGNGNLTFKIGLLTVDEAVYAGYVSDISNSTVYLIENATGSCWWTMSPLRFNRGANSVCCIDSGNLSAADVDDFKKGLRPAVSLVSDITISSGSGTSEDPYIVN